MNETRVGDDRVAVPLCVPLGVPLDVPLGVPLDVPLDVPLCVTIGSCPCIGVVLGGAYVSGTEAVSFSISNL
jgi:hypothetical protein